MLEDLARRRELKAFLRARREALSPQALGLTSGARRRTPGLRREEVASSAGVGVAWYTWLEQGREISVSREALGRIARALRLTATDEAYLFSLANRGDAAAGRSVTPYAVGPHELAVLDGLRALPGVILGPCLELLGSNALASVLFEITDSPASFADNQAWRLFMDPNRRALYAEDWAVVAERTVGVLRARHAGRVGDPQFEALLRALRAGSAEFNDLWRRGRTAALDNVDVRMSHPSLGRLLVTHVRFNVPISPDCFLSVMPPADERTSAAFAAAALAFPKERDLKRAAQAER